MLRANFSNFVNSFINPIEVDNDDYVPKGEAYVAGTTIPTSNPVLHGQIDSSKIDQPSVTIVTEPTVVVRAVDMNKINTDNPECLAPQNMFKGKRQIGDGVKKEHGAGIKKHKLSRTETSYGGDVEGPMNTYGDEDDKANKDAATLNTDGIVKHEVITEANGAKKEVVRVQNGLRTRSSPKTLCDTIKVLTAEQKAAVKDIGLEKLIGMKLDGIPIKLGFYVVDRFDSLKMVMNVNTGRIPITARSIHEILGLPIGGIDLKATDSDKGTDNVKTIWKKQYNKDRVRPMDIMHEIQRTKDHGFYFKLNFLVLVINVLAECSRVGTCYIGFLSHIKDVGMIAKVDWCKYIYDCLEVSKFKWSRESADIYYAGPLTYLTMLYVESTICATDTNQGPGMPLSKWTLELLRRRQEIEIVNGGIGSSMVKGLVSGSTKDIGRTSASGYPSDTIKAELSRELFLTKLDLKISDLIDMVLEVESMVSHASDRFPFDEEFNNLNYKLTAFLRNRKLAVNDGQMLNRDNKTLDNLGTPQPSTEPRKEPSIDNGTGKNHDSLGIDGEASPLSPIWTSPTLFREVDRVSGQKNDADPKTSGQANDNRKRSTALPVAKGNVVMMGSLDGCIVEPGEASKMNEGSGVVDNFINNEGNVGGCADFDPPGFDLGISPTQKDLKPMVKRLENETGEAYDMSGCGKRKTRPSVKVRSPYMERAVSFVVSRDEITTRDWVMRGIGESMEKLLLTKCGKSISRLELQTVTNQAFVSSKVIDVWAMILNDEEKLRSFDSPRRFFFSSEVSGDDGINDPGENTRETYGKFIRVIKRWCNNDTEMISMRNMDLVIFPVATPRQFYMVVFNLRQPSVCILDSEKQEGLIEDIYDFTPIVLLHMMSIHLRNEGNHGWKAFKEMNIEQMKVKWQVVGNKIDRGVMLMRNMETFMGSDLRLWNSGLYKESTKQKKQLKDLRVKFVSKILMSDLNVKKTFNIEDVQRFIAMEASVAYKKRQDGNIFPRTR